MFFNILSEALNFYINAARRLTQKPIAMPHVTMKIASIIEVGSVYRSIRYSASG
jgi:hypothetical protein